MKETSEKDRDKIEESQPVKTSYGIEAVAYGGRYYDCSDTGLIFQDYEKARTVFESYREDLLEEDLDPFFKFMLLEYKYKATGGSYDSKILDCIVDWKTAEEDQIDEYGQDISMVTKNNMLCTLYPFLREYDFKNGTDKETEYTRTLFDHLPSGWGRVFGEDLCKDMAAVLRKGKCLHSFRFYRIQSEGKWEWKHTPLPDDIKKELDRVFDQYRKRGMEVCPECGSPVDRVVPDLFYPCCWMHTPKKYSGSRCYTYVSCLTFKQWQDLNIKDKYYRDESCWMEATEGTHIFEDGKNELNEEPAEEKAYGLKVMDYGGRWLDDEDLELNIQDYEETRCVFERFRENLIDGDMGEFIKVLLIEYERKAGSITWDSKVIDCIMDWKTAEKMKMDEYGRNISMITKNKMLCTIYPFLRAYDPETGKDKESEYFATRLDNLPRGWNIGFGTELCEEMAKILRKGNLLYSFRFYPIFINNEWRWKHTPLPEDIRKELYRVFDQYRKKGMEVCPECGHAVDRIVPGTWYPCCWLHHPEKRRGMVVEHIYCMPFEKWKKITKKNKYYRFKDCWLEATEETENSG